MSDAPRYEAVPEELATETIDKLTRIRDEFIATLSAAKQAALTPRPVYLIELTRPEYPEDATDEQKEDIRLTFKGEPTGNVLLRFKLKARVLPKEGEPFDQAPVVVDAETGEKITQPVYDGSIIRVKGQVVPYTNAKDAVVGVTLRMKAVQVIDLKTGTGGGAAFWTDFS